MGSETCSQHCELTGDVKDLRDRVARVEVEVQSLKELKEIPTRLVQLEERIVTLFKNSDRTNRSIEELKQLIGEMKQEVTSEIREELRIEYQQRLEETLEKILAAIEQQSKGQSPSGFWATMEELKIKKLATLLGAAGGIATLLLAIAQVIQILKGVSAGTP